MTNFKIQEHLSLIDKYFVYLKTEKMLSDKSIASYKADLEGFIKFLSNKELTLIKVNSDDIQVFFENLYTKVLSTASFQRKLSTLRNFYKFLESEGLVDKNPVEGFARPKDKRKIPDFLTEEEIEKLLSTAKKDKSRNGVRFYAILELLYSSGMRISEVLEMPLGVIKMDKVASSVIIRGKGDKERVIFINEDTRNALKDFFEIRDSFLKEGKKSQFLFCSSSKEGHLSRQNFFVSLKKLAYLCDIDEEKVSPHKIRHSFATHCYRNGVNIRILQEMLGHSSISTTEIYTHTLTEDKKRLLENHHPLAKKNIS